MHIVVMHYLKAYRVNEFLGFLVKILIKLT